MPHAEAEPTPPPRPGRKFKKTNAIPKDGAAATVNARVAWKTRQALEEAAEREGKTISQMADLWLTEAMKGQASAAAILGAGSQEGVGVALLAMHRAAGEITEKVGNPLEVPEAHYALLRSWRRLIDLHLVTPPAIADRSAQSRQRISDAAALLVGALYQEQVANPKSRVLELANEKLPVWVNAFLKPSVNALSPNYHRANALALAQPTPGPSLKEMLQDAATTNGPDDELRISIERRVWHIIDLLKADDRLGEISKTVVEPLLALTRALTAYKAEASERREQQNKGTAWSESILAGHTAKSES